MKVYIVLPAGAIVAAALAGCGGGALAAHSPAHSAPHACSDFRNWYFSQGGDLLSGKDAALLGKAVSESPSGQLYVDLSTLQSDVQTGAAYGAAGKTLILTAAYAVAQDCRSVNPSGG